MSNKPTISESEIQFYLSEVQTIITRMASNASSCKTWCITVSGAILAYLSQHGGLQQFWWMLVLIVLICGSLDSYYLVTEIRFRNLYNTINNNYHEGKLLHSDLYKLYPKKQKRDIQKTVKSVSVLPYLIAMLIIFSVALIQFLISGGLLWLISN